VFKPLKKILHAIFLWEKFEEEITGQKF